MHFRVALENVAWYQKLLATNLYISEQFINIYNNITGITGENLVVFLINHNS